MDQLVSLNNAGVSIGGQAILRDLDLQLGASDILGVVGPNGSGKTTLLRLLATLVLPDQGESTVLGARLGTGEAYRIRHRIGLIGHTPALISELTIEENLHHAVRLGGLDESKVGTSLSVVGLEAAKHRRIDASSYGMQRRAEIALLLIRRPSLLLLDEPTSGLDPQATDLVRALIDRTIDSKGAVVIVSHDRTQLGGCQQIIELPSGRAAS